GDLLDMALTPSVPSSRVPVHRRRGDLSHVAPLPGGIDRHLRAWRRGFVSRADGETRGITSCCFRSSTNCCTPRRHKSRYAGPLGLIGALVQRIAPNATRISSAPATTPLHRLAQ